MYNCSQVSDVYGNVKFGNLGLSENSVFFRKYSSLGFESLYMQTTNWANEGMEGQGHSLNLVPGHSHMKVKTCFSKKLLGHF